MEDSIGELKAAIWSLTKLHPDECRIKIGFPPEEVFLVDDSQQIGEIFKNPRETMLLEEAAGSGGKFVKFYFSKQTNPLLPFQATRIGHLKSRKLSHHHRP